jgi:diguanylate cyclase (GGDEF)-like protein
LRLPHLIPQMGHDRNRDALIEKATREAESGRRLAMYDRETGLYAHWYLAQRFDEEARRSERYSRPLSVVLIEVRSNDAYRTQDEVRNWLSGCLRSTDMASHLGGGRYVALLTETPLDDAAAIAARLAESFPDTIAIGLGHFPDDGDNLVAVQTVAQRRAHGNWALAI